jgi:hypothetical protein
MTRSTLGPTLRLAVVAALVLGLAIGLAGCGSKGSSTSPTSTAPAASTSGPTAKQQLSLAQSALATSVPDAKLLLVAAGSAITATMPPDWQYLFGSPKTGDTWAVLIQNGKATSMKYGTAQLTAKQWAQVPTPDQWKIDSDVAHTKALAIYPGAKPETPYIIGFVTYIPPTAKQVQTPAMTWSISFDPTTKGSAPTTTVNVSAVTGAASFPK